MFHIQSPAQLLPTTHLYHPKKEGGRVHHTQITRVLLLRGVTLKKDFKI